MDGTLVDYDGALRRDMLKLAAPGELVNYRPHAHDMAHLKAREDLIKRQPGWWRNLEPLPSGKLIMNELFALCFKINILTKAPYKNCAALAEKGEWCRMHYQDQVMITLTEDKGLVYGKVLVDEWIPYILRWLQWRPRGFVVLPDREYNEGFTHPNVFRFRGEQDLPELRDKLSEIRSKCSP